MSIFDGVMIKTYVACYGFACYSWHK